MCIVPVDVSFLEHNKQKVSKNVTSQLADVKFMPSSSRNFLIGKLPESSPQKDLLLLYSLTYFTPLHSYFTSFQGILIVLAHQPYSENHCSRSTLSTKNDS